MAPAPISTVIGNSAPATVRHSWLVAIVMWIKRVWCGIVGHEYQLHAAPGRIYLQCAACDRQTPGWVIGVLATPRSHRHRRE